MSATNDTPVRFTGIRERTLEHQQQAIADGYASVEQWAIDHLAARVIELEARCDELEMTWQRTFPEVSEMERRGWKPPPDPED